MFKQKLNETQKHKLLQLMVNRPNLRSGKFTQNFSHRDAQNEWQNITEILNSLPGATKDWKGWRKTWQDITSKTKSKAAKIKKIQRGTGGGPPPSDSLDQFEEGVAALLHQHAISGHQESMESAVIFEDIVPIENNSAYVTSDSRSPPHTFDAAILPPPFEFAEVNVSSVEIPESPSRPQINDNRKEKEKKVNLKTLLKEKVNLKKQLLEEKKKFYEESIKNMKRQTKALEDISRAIINISNSNSNSNIVDLEHNYI